jgi:hypothetical protein
MRTTLDIADDVLLAAIEAADRRQQSLGAVVSDLVRRALVGSCDHVAHRRDLALLDIRPLPFRGGVVSSEVIHRLCGDGLH